MIEVRHRAARAPWCGCPLTRGDAKVVRKEVELHGEGPIAIRDRGRREGPRESQRVTCHQWFTGGLKASRIFPTICVHICRVVYVSCQAAKGRLGHTAVRSRWFWPVACGITLSTGRAP